MALSSPGVQVTVIDESFYTPAEPGTTPLIVVATAQDKINAAGTGIAAATTKANAGRAFRLTSQRDLVDLFGVPFFEKAVGENPVHGGERNEYGLLAAYSYLGVSNSAFLVRADVDLAQLEGQALEPGANPADGAWWVDTAATSWGIQEWNSAPIDTVGGQKFANKVPLVLTDADSTRVGDGGFPKESVGTIGDYAVVYNIAEGGDIARIFYKSPGGVFGIAPGAWVQLGTADWVASNPTVIGAGIEQGYSAPADDIQFEINGTPVTIPEGTASLQAVADIINGLLITGVRAAIVSNRLNLYSDGSSLSDSTVGVINIEGDADELALFGLVGNNTDGIDYFAPALAQSPHTSVPRWKAIDDNSRPTGSVWIKTTEPNLGARWFVKQWNAATEDWVRVNAPLYADSFDALASLDRAGGGANIPVNSLFVEYDANFENTAAFRIWRKNNEGATVIRSAVITGFSGAVEFAIAESIVGLKSYEFKTITIDAGVLQNDAADSDRIAAAINAAGFVNLEASVTDNNEIEITHKAGGVFLIDELGDAVAGQILGSFAASQNLYSAGVGDDADWLVSNFQPLLAKGFDVLRLAPTNAPVDGQLWYNPEFSEVDLMVHNGETWVGINNDLDYNEAEVIVSVLEPELTENQERANNHIWISTADLENFPTMYRWNSGTKEWILLDTTDQVSEDGVLFADARYGLSGATGDEAGAIAQLRTSNYVDPDAPDPALYPRGMLLWNTRRSGGNVKRYAVGYIDKNAANPRFDAQASPAGETFFAGESMSGYALNRWVTASANNEDGSGSFGRNAQRKVVVSALKSAVDTSQEIRDEERRNFNLIAAPGYVELLSNLVNLNIDRGLTSFVVGDTPFRLPSDATSLTRWGTNENLVFDNGDDGIVTYDEYMACFYPSGFTTDLGGANAVVPPSHMMLRTIALSDNVSYPWFAPAGTRRGGITNATAVGYIDGATGEFQTVALNEGTRAVLQELQINPLTFFNGVGLVNYGQKTRARNASALDRINVARLVVYLRSQLNKLARPYIFEPNDKITRDEIKQAVESLLLELVGLRALFDFAVVCDESNNTPSRIDRNELWVDIAIEPVKAVEFIYIPLRVKNTGEI